jgi:hypothetical protein
MSPPFSQTRIAGPTAFLSLNTLSVIAIFLVLLCIYVFTSPSVITFEDAGLFQQVCYFGGIAHPPGYPLFTLLCQPFVHLPFAEPLLLGNLLSSIFAAATCCVVFRILVILQHRSFIAVFTALMLGLSNTFWSQAIIIEVYTLNALLCCLLLLFSLHLRQAGERKYLFLLAFTYGLALANHWPLVILFTPGLVILLAGSEKMIMQQILLPLNLVLIGMLFLLGLTPYLSLLWKSDPFISYSGSIDSLEEFVRYIARDSYRGVDNSPSAGISDKLYYSGWLLQQLTTQFGLPAFLLVVAGLVTSFRAQAIQVALGLLFIFAFTSFVLVALLGFDFEFIHQAVFKPYLIPAYIILALWLAIGCQWLYELVCRFMTDTVLRLMTGVIGLVCALPLLGMNFVANDRHDAWLADEYARLVLASLPPDAVLMIYADNQIFPIGYLQSMESIRTDVHLFHTGGVIYHNPVLENLITEDARNEAIAKFVSQTTRPVYQIGVDWLDGVACGLFVKVKPADAAGCIESSGQTQFLEKLLSAYKKGQIIDAHELHFAQQLLLAFSEQYLHEVFDPESHADIDQDRISLMLELQSTFPGKLATLSYVLNNPNVKIDKRMLIEMADAAIRHIPVETGKQFRGQILEYMAFIQQMDSAEIPANLALARHYYEASLDEYFKTSDHRTCALYSINTRMDNVAANTRLALTYDLSSCEVPVQSP